MRWAVAAWWFQSLLIFFSLGLGEVSGRQLWRGFFAALGQQQGAGSGGGTDAFSDLGS